MEKIQKRIGMALVLFASECEQWQHEQWCKGNFILYK